MCTSFANDLKRWTCDEERAARDAMLEGWAQALHEAAHPASPAPIRDAADAAATGLIAPTTATRPSLVVSNDAAAPIASSPA